MNDRSTNRREHRCATNRRGFVLIPRRFQFGFDKLAAGETREWLCFPKVEATIASVNRLARFGIFHRVRMNANHRSLAVINALSPGFSMGALLTLDQTAISLRRAQRATFIAATIFLASFYGETFAIGLRTKQLDGSTVGRLKLGNKSGKIRLFKIENFVQRGLSIISPILSQRKCGLSINVDDIVPTIPLSTSKYRRYISNLRISLRIPTDRVQ